LKETEESAESLFSPYGRPVAHPAQKLVLLSLARLAASMLDEYEDDLPEELSQRQSDFANSATVLSAAIEVYERMHDIYKDKLKSVKYKTYLKTWHWSVIRARALEAAKNKCQVCNGGPPLNVHHRTYIRRGEERPEDMTVLCAKCHSEFHKNGKLEPEPED
jgi:hypothetical protein